MQGVNTYGQSQGGTCLAASINMSRVNIVGWDGGQGVNI